MKNTPFLLLSNILPTAAVRNCTARVETPSKGISHLVIGNIPPIGRNTVTKYSQQT